MSRRALGLFLMTTLVAMQGCADTRAVLTPGRFPAEVDTRATTRPASPAAPRAIGLGELASLLNALDSFPGCLGTERAVTASGKLTVFAWFESKRALQNWYYSTAHQDVISPSPRTTDHQPLAHIPDDTGPILAVACITVANSARLLTGEVPVSQIAIELYQPLPGGHYFAHRFSPPTVHIPHSVDIANP